MPEGAARRDTDRGMGLVSMRERAELMGGELQVRRPAEGGTTVHLRVVGCMDRAGARNEVA
jgi:signal transduction histidine kinase